MRACWHRARWPGIIDDLPSCAELIETIVNDAIKHLQAAAALVD